MISPKEIEETGHAEMMDMGGFPVRQAFPTQLIPNVGPFLLLHHADIKVPGNVPVSKAGVGPHPHRGFSPVTFIFKGGVHHRDSRGNDNVVYEGGVQWMRAGMGIIHSERPPKDIFEIGGKQEIVQLWVDSPADRKMDVPEYFPLQKEEIPTIQSEDGLTTIQVVSGELDGVKGNIPLQSPVNTFTVFMESDAAYLFNVPDNHVAFVYVLSGNVGFDGAEGARSYSIHSVITFRAGPGPIMVFSKERSTLLIGSAEPLDQKIVSHGPFVMTSETEILEAFRDYRLGKMGVLIED